MTQLSHQGLDTRRFACVWPAMESPPTLAALKSRVEGLQELLDSTSADTPEKLAEVVQMSREMAELQKMAAELRGRDAEGALSLNLD